MSLFGRREKQVRKHIDEYFRFADQVFDDFQEAMKKYLKAGRCDELTYDYKKIHASESRADDLRVEIEKDLYRRALLPESRGDILGLLESFDKMPNIAEMVVRSIAILCIEVPETYRDRLQGMVELNVDSYRLVRQGVEALFSSPDTVDETVAPVDKLESASDQLEQELISEVFRSGIDKADMLILRQLIHMIGDVSDSAERVAQRLTILSFKRRV